VADNHGTSETLFSEKDNHHKLGGLTNQNCGCPAMIVASVPKNNPER